MLVYKIASKYCVSLLPSSQKLTSVHVKPNLETIIVVDVSESMGSISLEIINYTLPHLLEEVGFLSTDDITMITFNSSSNITKTYVEQLKTFDVETVGPTHMNLAIKDLNSILKDNPEKDFQIIFFSAGNLSDDQETIDEINKIKETTKTCLNSFIVEIETDTLHSDNCAFCFLNTLNDDHNINNKFSLVPTSDKYEIVSNMVKQFANQNSNESKKEFVITCDKKILLDNLWDTKFPECSKVYSNNVAWMTELPKSITVNSQTKFLELSTDKQKILQIINQEIPLLNKIDPDMKSSEIQNKIDFIIKTCRFVRKILKDELNNDRVKDWIEKILELLDKSFKKNVQQYKFKSLAEFNRSQESLKNGLNECLSDYGLARKAAQNNPDFNFRGTIIKEIKEAYKNRSKLYRINNENLTKSFYSGQTTYDGIINLFETIVNGTINTLDLKSLLILFNFVGIACFTKIQKYYHTKKISHFQIYPNTFLSISDIIHASNFTNASLNTPSSRQPINNVIPYIENEDLKDFIESFFPNLVQYTVSYGVRRLVGNFKGTYQNAVFCSTYRLRLILIRENFSITRKVASVLIKNYMTSISKEVSKSGLDKCIGESGENYKFMFFVDKFIEEEEHEKLKETLFMAHSVQIYSRFGKKNKIMFTKFLIDLNKELNFISDACCEVDFEDDYMINKNTIFLNCLGKYKWVSLWAKKSYDIMKYLYDITKFVRTFRNKATKDEIKENVDKMKSRINFISLTPNEEIKTIDLFVVVQKLILNIECKNREEALKFFRVNYQKKRVNLKEMVKDHFLRTGAVGNSN